MHYVNQGCPGQLPLTMHIQLFQPACSSDKESACKWFPLAVPPARCGARHPKWTCCIFFPLLPDFFFCWCPECGAFHEGPLKGKSVRSSKGNIKRLKILQHRKTNTLSVQCFERKQIYLKYTTMKCCCYQKFVITTQLTQSFVSYHLAW